MSDEKKKKERPNNTERNLWIFVMIFGVLVLLWVIGSFLTNPHFGSSYDAWPETEKAIVATNNAVATHLQETYVAATASTFPDLTATLLR